MENKHDGNLSKKIEKLRASKEYASPVVSPEGYGSFISARDSFHGPLEPLHVQAKLLKSEADAANSKDSVQLYLESLFCYLRIQAQMSKSDMKVYLNMLKFVIKFTEHIHSQAGKYNCSQVAKALEWALFNLKLFKLIKDADFLPKNIDAGLYRYVIDVIKGLDVYYDSKSPESIEIVPIERIEEGIKKRM
ncbi:uncharacterized protein VICG_00248 [Vittaforma corneae ATCC 50505]|uniref:Uncharacterized protein n=1 Tax=Vittaforma corneae (strain ATCC 50505) TaxID=993615 RepID=L2GPV9_VITCO|nr:uncharacterized protein VICG_00248 [Vittaforma corneae ATCC 50505]ELA42933.1 hypothetical protein VICG_00248 [Vittaforma corneae ATCC 50505]